MIGRMVKALAVAGMLAGMPVAGPAQEQERPEGCVIEQWPAFLAPGPQEHSVRETLETDAGAIHAIEFGPPAGEYAKLFLFFLVHDGCERKVFSVGSYGYMNDFARERGEIGEGGRVYHLDLYEPERHTTLEMRYDRPGYAEMRERALNLLR
ncbi:MAG TPA: hypothetical protein VMM59_08595 [Thermohalobaculum sp.]|nr:hypothetical protein [Thermohalobaculum sp.]